MHRLLDEGLALPTLACDAERLPFGDGSFDVAQKGMPIEEAAGYAVVVDVTDGVATFDDNAGPLTALLAQAAKPAPKKKGD